MDKYTISKEKLIELVDLGWPNSKIARYFSCSWPVIDNRIKRWNIQRTHTTYRPELIGSKFTRILVVSYNLEKSKNKRSYWNCQCDCGKKIVLEISSFSPARPIQFLV